MSWIRLSAPITLSIAAACVLATYLPDAGELGISGSLASLAHPLTWVRLFTWPLVHASTEHLLGNLMLFLLLSPTLEHKQGPANFLLCLAACAVVIGLGHLVFGPSGTVLVGASGWVFMMILLSTFTTGEAGAIPLHTLLVAGLYGWREIRAAMTPNNVSQFAHFLGGGCGLLFGYLGRARKPKGSSR